MGPTLRADPRAPPLTSGAAVKAVDTSPGETKPCPARVMLSERVEPVQRQRTPAPGGGGGVERGIAVSLPAHSSIE